MKTNQTALAAGIAAALASSVPADAAVMPMMLKSDVSYSNNGTASAFLGSSTATWSYDTVSGVLTATGGTFNVRFNITPATTLFRHSITGLVIGAGGAAAATTYACTEGNFGTIASAASLCGNYNFGANFTNESSTTWGPGIAAARTIGGDDMVVGPMQQLNGLIGAYDTFITTSFDGTTLVLSNAACLSAATLCATLPDTFSGGYKWTLLPDNDSDLLENTADNCRNLANNTGTGAQADSDGDGFGNRCDGDFGNPAPGNGATNSQDYVIFRTQIGAPSVAPTFNKADINANGAVNSQDYVLFRALIGSGPGPGAGP